MNALKHRSSPVVGATVVAGYTNCRANLLACHDHWHGRTVGQGLWDAAFRR